MKRRWNWHLWAGFLFCIAALVSYTFVFAKYPVTRDIPWANFLLFAVGGVLLFVGLQRAFGQPQQYRGKITGPILSALSLAALGFFCYVIFFLAKQLPPPSTALGVGQKAPEFVLADTNGNPIALSSLLSSPMPGLQTPPKGVLLVFYRGYW
jgi:drug/metabolite transporter (DMT)-like permease